MNSALKVQTEPAQEGALGGPAAEPEEILRRGFFFLRFPQHLEASFLDYYYTSNLKRIRIALLAGIFLYAVYGVIDFLLLSDVRGKIWFIRYALVCPTGVTVFLFSYSRHFKRFLQPTLLLAMLIAALGIIAMLAIDPVIGGHFYYTGLLLAIMFTFTLIGLRFWYALAWAAMVVLCYDLMALLINSTSFPILVHNTFNLVSATSIGAFSNYLMEYYLRRDFLQALLLEYEKVQLLEQSTKLHELSTQDELTGIANRRQFESVFQQEWQRACRTQESLALLLIDIDSFKAFNDNYGHQAGDECLRLVAGVLKSLARRPGDLAARYGGEEFTLILSATEADGAADLAEGVRSAVEALQISHAHSPAGPLVTVSAGVAAVIPSPFMDRKILVELADQALYEAKRQGRNRIFVHCHGRLSAPFADQQQLAFASVPARADRTRS